VKKQIDVVGAVVLSSGQVLCVRRGPHGSLAGKWEFPGGKIEHGESAQEALEREIFEELMCRVEAGEHITTTRYEYDFAIVNLSTFYCQLLAGQPRLVEHAQMAWLAPTELGEVDWAPADIPAVHLIQSRLVANGPKAYG
jgi:8-oxo-dGTP diphosphatase